MIFIWYLQNYQYACILNRYGWISLYPFNISNTLRVWSMKDYIPELVQINFFTFFLFFAFCIGACAGKNNSLPESSNDDVLAGIVNPFNSTCYDWRGNNIPCNFKQQYAELLLDRSIPDPLADFWNPQIGVISSKNMISTSRPKVFVFSKYHTFMLKRGTGKIHKILADWFSCDTRNQLEIRQIEVVLSPGSILWYSLFAVLVY